MRRVGLFITAGPAIGWTLTMLMSLFVGSRFPAMHASAMFVLFALIASLLPSIIAGIVDTILREKDWRVWPTTVTGAVVSLSQMLYIHDSVTALSAVSFGLVGAVPAAVCSWLSNEKQNR